jgi:hypothetical protein
VPPFEEDVSPVGSPPKDLHETIHHLVPLLCEGFLNQQFERISCTIIFLFSYHERSLGHVRVSFLMRNKLETQLFVLRPHWGHAFVTHPLPTIKFFVDFSTMRIPEARSSERPIPIYRPLFPCHGLFFTRL